MSKRWFCLPMTAFLAALLPAAPVGDDVQEAARAANEFACRMFSQLAQGEGNSFFSPFSISSALTMTYAGARGRTAEQMAAVLGFSLPKDRLYPALSELQTRFNAKGKPYQLHVANALWAQAGYPFAPDYLRIVKTYFEAGLQEVDYVNDANREKARRTINAWIEERTADKIKELIKTGILNDLTRLVLTNAIYFKGDWELQFDKADTRKMPFAVSKTEKTDVPMMRRSAEFGYAETARVQVLEMRYAGGDLSMVVLLPTEASGVGELLEVLPRKLDGWLAALSEEKINVYLPRFKLEQEFVLNNALIALGMVDAFSENDADFSGMSTRGGLYFSKVIHKAFVDVNEEGTEAAAATGATLSLTAFAPPRVFKADHPFLFLIRDLRTGTILFMGRMARP